VTVNLLSARGLTVRYGRLAALADVSFTVPAGMIVGCIGPNGAGKSTLVGVLSGDVEPAAGEVMFDGRGLRGLAPEAIAGLGLIRTFQLVQPFLRMSVLECVMIGLLHGSLAGRARSMREAESRGREVLAAFNMSHRADALAETLNVPERKRLELARAAACRPKMLLLDEVLAGLGGDELQEALVLIRGLRERGTTILVIEHVVEAIRVLCDRIVVLRAGEVIADDNAAAVLSDSRVIEAYLGRRTALALSAHWTN
jgi:branched-chain amino acid transport system ATP-binding protein